MNERLYQRLWALLALLVGLSGFGMALAGLSTADGAAAQVNTLDRDLEPIIINGADLPGLAGAPVDDLFAFAYTDGAWAQIPIQVDEMAFDVITKTFYVTMERSSALDPNDEIVFMAMDTGDKAPASEAPMMNGQPVNSLWYEVEITDPTAPSKKGWAYLVRSPTLEHISTDYVNFNTLLSRIVGQNYRTGFGTSHRGIEYLALGGGLTDILDRSKIQIFCNIDILCPTTEETGVTAPPLDGLIKDGAVRVIVRGGRIKGYGSMIRWTRPITVPEIIAGDMRIAMDFNSNAVGATLYNAAVSDGVTVDGVADTVAEQPYSAWWQLSTNNGTVVQVADTSSLGGTQTNHYIDDSATDESDTGDQQHYGEIGVHIVNPNLMFTYSIAQYFLSGSQANLGAQYATYNAQPLLVDIQFKRLTLAEKSFLPLVEKGAIPTPTPSPTPVPTCLSEPGNWIGQESEGGLPISFSVTTSCRVNDLTITVPFNGSNCTVAATRDLPQANDRFAFIYLGGVITGTFTSPSDANGTYRVITCNNTTLDTAVEGTWTARK